MGFNSKVIHQAIKEQMRGRVPDLNRIKREQQEKELEGTLSCSWGKDKNGRLFYGVKIMTMYGKEMDVHKFYDVSQALAREIQEKVIRYNRTHKPLLVQLSRNQSVSLVKKVQKDLNELINVNER